MPDRIKDKSYANRINVMHFRIAPTTINDIEFKILVMHKFYANTIQV